MNKTTNGISELSDKELMDYSGGIGPGMIGVGLCGFGVGVVVGFVAVAALYYVVKNVL